MQNKYLDIYEHASRSTLVKDFLLNLRLSSLI